MSKYIYFKVQLFFPSKSDFPNFMSIFYIIGSSFVFFVWQVIFSGSLPNYVSKVVHPFPPNSVISRSRSGTGIVCAS